MKVLLLVIIAALPLMSCLEENKQNINTNSLIVETNNITSDFYLDEFKINTADIEEPHLLRVSINVEYNNNALLKNELLNKKSQIRIIILQLLNSKFKKDLDDKESLKKDIEKSINNILNKGKIKIEFIYFLVS